MKAAEINSAIAVLCGWVKVVDDPDYEAYWVAPVDKRRIGIAANPAPYPDYANDLNAMHAAEEFLGSLGKWWEFCDQLKTIVPMDKGKESHVGATSEQRAEAFLRAFGRWRE